MEQTVKECCRDGARLAELKNLVASHAINVRAKDSSGLNVLMHAAIGSNGEPNHLAISYLILQKEQPFDAHEKAEVFELLGSSYILMHDFKKGLKFWENSACWNRSCLPAKLLPPVISQCMAPEWTNRSDVLKMSEQSSSAIGQLNIVYQAMLIRRRWCRSELPADIRRQLKFVNTEVGLTKEFAVMLLELDEVYGSHSLSLIEKRVMNIAKRAVCHLSWYDSSRDQVFIKKCFVVLNWFGTECLRPNLDKLIWHTIGYEVVILLTIVFQTSLDENQSSELKAILKKFLTWHDERQMNLLALTCESLNKYYSNTLTGKQHPTVNEHYWSWFSQQMAQLVRMLVEVGVDVNYAGKRCEELLINERDGSVVSPLIYQFLLNF